MILDHIKERFKKQGITDIEEILISQELEIRYCRNRIDEIENYYRFRLKEIKGQLKDGKYKCKN